MESEKRLVARIREAEQLLNEAIRDAGRFGLLVEIDTIEVSTLVDQPAQHMVSLRIMREL